MLILVLMMSSMAAYFMDSYKIVIDGNMIDNVMRTDFHEAYDLISLKMALYLLLLGIVPSFFIFNARITNQGWIKSSLTRTALISGSLLIPVIIILTFGDYYASFFRGHKELRSYANPAYPIYSGLKYLGQKLPGNEKPFTSIGLDAYVPAEDEHRELIIFVVGETARSDHFSLNGYQRETNPKLHKQDVTSFSNFWSCGTSTAISVPCMFSSQDREDFNIQNAKTRENLLDILQHAGANVLWLDNNSSSKGVADRVNYASYKNRNKNPVCDIECRDEGMLSQLDNYIKNRPVGDIMIVLHQMGNHGPAYYKRYPPAFAKFQPACSTNQLDQCSSEEITNAYDNALLYTDHFLNRTIEFLKPYSGQFETAMIYASDHGESLGENGLYLHGLPYPIAPDSQKHVPVVMWFGKSFEAD
jgi:lipid A ethanolaminephosphotransferase